MPANQDCADVLNLEAGLALMGRIVTAQPTPLPSLQCPKGHEAVDLKCTRSSLLGSIPERARRSRRILSH
eukprot:2621872-Prymnesium_polylepis.1